MSSSSSLALREWYQPEMYHTAHFFTWYYLFVSLMPPFAFEGKSCDVYWDDSDAYSFITSIVEIHSQRTSSEDMGDSVAHLTATQYKWMSAGAALTQQWILTSVSFQPDVAKTVVLYSSSKFSNSGTKHEVEKIVYYPSKSDEFNLGLVKLSGTSSDKNDSADLAKLPRTEGYTKGCKKVMLLGYPVSEREDHVACMNGDKSASCSSNIELTAMKESVRFCFDDAKDEDLLTTMGALLLCMDNDDKVLIGMTKGYKKAEAVGMFTKWIADTTGLEVGYKATPVHTSNGAAWHGVDGWLWVVVVVAMALVGWC